jgi:hypothetical protein
VADLFGSPDTDDFFHMNMAMSREDHDVAPAQISAFARSRLAPGAGASAPLRDTEGAAPCGLPASAELFQSNVTAEPDTPMIPANIALAASTTCVTGLTTPASEEPVQSRMGASRVLATPGDPESAALYYSMGWRA